MYVKGYSMILRGTWYVEFWCSMCFLVVLGCCVVAEAQCPNGSHRVSRCVFRVFKGC